jgi:ATP:ADP antiporter, AAA family
MDKDSQFGKLRSFFWPIHSNELKKFIPMIIIFFLITFNYHLLRILKDTLVITQKHSGAEAIPFLKLWAILPSAFFMTYFFTKLCNKFKKEYVFYIMSLFFIGFFIIYTVFLHPNCEALNLDTFADSMQGVLPSGAKGFIAIFRYWSSSLFYIMAESWSIIMYSVILWGFANDVTSVKEARRFYALFGIGVNSAGILAGKFGELLTGFIQKINVEHKNVLSIFGKNLWDQELTIFIISMIISTVIAMALYRYLHIKVINKEILLKLKLKSNSSFSEKKTALKKPKIKMSLRKNISFVLRSKYLIYIAVIVLSYNIMINFTEVLWKSQLKELYPNKHDYTQYMSRVTFYIGLLATFASFFVSGNLIRKLGWKITAIVTPVIIIITGVFFFNFLFLKQYFYTTNAIIPILGMTPLALTVFFGSMQNILARTSKYTVFDETKEMAFIPLSSENKMKGKSAIDGIGSRLGKSGGSLVMQVLLIFFASPVACAPIIFAAMAFVIPVWIYAISNLSTKFADFSGTNEDKILASTTKATTSEALTPKTSTMNEKESSKPEKVLETIS